MAKDKSQSHPLMTKRVVLQDRPSPQASWRERRGAPRIGQFVPKLTKAANKRFGFAEPHILNYWAEIVGADLAKHTAPEKLSRDARQGHGGALTVRVSGPIGLEIQHMEPQILERINRYYGFNAVSHLRLVRGPQTAKAGSRRQRRTQPLSADQQTRLKDTLDGIQDADLRETLKAMGESILRKQRQR